MNATIEAEGIRPMRMHRSDRQIPVEVIILAHVQQYYVTEDQDIPGICKVTTANLQPKTAGSAAIDLITPVDIILGPGETTVISTGVRINILVEGIAGVVMPRSGLGSKTGLVLANTVGLIDTDYQGEIALAVMNRNPPDFNIGVSGQTVKQVGKKIRVEKGTRIAQMMFVPYWHPDWRLVTEFSNTTTRGAGGFGSTGQR